MEESISAGIIAGAIDVTADGDVSIVAAGRSDVTLTDVPNDEEPGRRTPGRPILEEGRRPVPRRVPTLRRP